MLIREEYYNWEAGLMICEIPPYIAHIDEQGNIQTVKQHSENTAELSGSFAVDEFKDICYEIGLLHDVGKYLKTFQKRIRGANCMVEHSICGAKEVKGLCVSRPLALLMELCIAGHHTGIPNCGSLQEEQSLYNRMQKKCEDYSAYKQDLNFACPSQKTLATLMVSGIEKDKERNAKASERFAFFVRYCFSCLTDADSIDTMAAIGELPENILHSDFSACQADLERQLQAFINKTPLQKARAKLQNQAFQNIQQDAEIYLMNMPTGSGKTLAGMECALKRAAKGKKRIIYVIPYNSIIDQTVDTFEKLFGSHAQILRHQSSFSYEDLEDIDEDYRNSAKYACENWDAQIIITTAVQFFESIYANKRGRLRKMHNMAESVIVFDEAHLMPVQFLQPCLRGISYITRFLHSEAIFLTATMTDFKQIISQYAIRDSKICDLIPDQSDFKYFKKCEYRNLGDISDEALLENAQQYQSALIVVNSRRAAQKLYDLCSAEAYHLSTYMTGADRSRAINKIRERLKQLREDYPEGSNVPMERRIIVVSTSLIEAGVDLDFYAAFRELSGLDNVLQTGGRCNREGLQASGTVSVFSRADSTHKQTVEQNILLGIMKEFADISSSQAIAEYYRRLFAAKEQEITSHSLGDVRYDQIAFKDYSENFNLIDSKTESVMVPCNEESGKMAKALSCGEKINIRSIQKYCCTVYPYELEELIKQHAVAEYNGIFALTNTAYYSPKTGIKFQGEDIFI
jgi:CRISPR-associated endonuclease/helicase Cas3